MTTVYRAYDGDGRLLYVGMTDDLEVRFKTHERESGHWVHDMRRLAVEHYPTRQQARAAELTAIKTERPLWNIHGSPRADEVARTLYERKCSISHTPRTPYGSPEWEKEFRREMREVFRIRRLVQVALYPYLADYYAALHGPLYDDGPLYEQSA